ncbi:hypothetical protein J4E82_009289, partial [Alternaria postmessia]|uniref:uncharacterized protein n=1 Tax=Alternaria postmessia TaxID=1187938 RepID=UPI002224BAF0
QLCLDLMEMISQMPSMKDMLFRFLRHTRTDRRLMLVELSRGKVREQGTTILMMRTMTRTMIGMTTMEMTMARILLTAAILT